MHQDDGRQIAAKGKETDPERPEGHPKDDDSDRNRTYTIRVNKDDFHNQPRIITGEHVLKLSGENDGEHSVAILRGGSEHDFPVGLHQDVDLEDPKNRRFKTFPDKSTEGANCR